MATNAIALLSDPRWHTQELFICGIFRVIFLDVVDHERMKLKNRTRIYSLLFHSFLGNENVFLCPRLNGKQAEQILPPCGR